MRISTLILTFAASFIGFSALSGLTSEKPIETAGTAVRNFMATPANADEPAVPIGNPAAIDFSRLIQIGDEDFTISDPTGILQQDGQSVTEIRKIGFGKVTRVNVVRSNLGTFTTDGLASPNVIYPGIEVERADNPAIFSELLAGRWAPLSVLDKGTVVTFGRTDHGGGYLNAGSLTCVRGKGFSSCS